MNKLKIAESLSISTIIVVVVILASYWVRDVGQALNQGLTPKPLVFWSWSQNKCQKVIRYVDDKEVFCDCSTLTDKETYTRVWVK